MLEILSPAGCPEGVVAAVQNGADAVYMGFGEHNARRNAKNFTQDEFRRAVEYCRVRGVKSYLTLNTLASDRELPQMVEHAKVACRAGVNAIIVQDLGAALAFRRCVPEVAIHASTQMGIHNLEGVKMAAAMGITRVVLARELSAQEIAYICKHSPIEIEVFVHGALCMGYSGACYMSAVIGRRSGNRGLCAQPCRLNYSTGGHGADYLLSLKDNCLVNYLQELDSVGVAAIKIEGRMKRPEYSAIVTGIYAKAVRKGKPPSQEELDALKTAFSRGGFTDGFYTGKTGREMFGVRGEDHDSNNESVIFTSARKNYMQGEFQRVPVRFVGQVVADKPVKLAAIDDRRNKAYAEGPVPHTAFHRELTTTAMQTQLYKTGGTPFYCAGVKGRVDPGLYLPPAVFNEMRRELLTELLTLRQAPGYRIEREYQEFENQNTREGPPEITISVMKASQLSNELAELAPRIVYIPVLELSGDSPVVQSFLNNPDITVAVSLPRVIHDNERREISAALKKAHDLGVSEALCGNLGQIRFARKHEMKVRGDYGLNVYNSHALSVLSGIGLRSATLSFELRLAQVRDLSKPLDTELIVYGRLPLMVTKNCVIKNSTGACSCGGATGITDRRGAVFPVVQEFGCRNVVLNSKKLFMADRQRELASLGLWATRLAFTTENARECVSVMKRYQNMGDYEPVGFTRGLYYRGVE